MQNDDVTFSNLFVSNSNTPSPPSTIRYISILPPVYLGSRIDTKTIISKMAKQDPAPATPNRTQSSRETVNEGSDRIELDTAGSGDEMGVDSLDRKYYLNAFYCLVLALLVMVLLFFICKFLNECQISPRVYRRRRRTGLDLDELFESVPISLRGQTQVCFCSHGVSLLILYKTTTKTKAKGKGN